MRKYLENSTDHTDSMIDSTTMTLLITCFACGICVLCMYSVYANVIRHETTLHDLRNRVEYLQNQQTLRIAELKGEIPPMDVEIVEDAPDEQGSDTIQKLSDDGSDPIGSIDTEPDQDPSATSSSTKAA